MKEKFSLLQKVKSLKISLQVRFILLAVVVNLIVEMFSRHSILEGFAYMLTNPLCFIYGVILILFTMSFAVLVHRKVFALTLICGIWIIGGIVDFVVTGFRHTPFTAQDFRLLKYAFEVAPVYLSNVQIIIVVVLSVLFMSAMVVWWFKAPKYKEKINYFKALVVVLSCWFVVWAVTRVGVSVGVLAKNFGNIGNAYNEYGFAYCFSNSLLNSGIDKPKDYNENTIKDIMAKIEELESQRDEFADRYKDADEDKIESEPATETESAVNNETSSTQETEQDEDYAASEQYPNIIFLQLESLFDPQLLKDVEYSRTVLPTLEWLYKYYPTGFLSVPSVGAGTANTEFEIISGMNLDDFGPGEYPYKTVLSHSACDSICFDLKKYGYTTNAVHDNDGTFYDRNSVFSQLGFDTFTSLEYMNNVQYNDIGWADDSVLTQQIVEILNGSEGRDFIYTISVQGHGDYPSDYEIKPGDIRAKGEAVEDFIQPFTYYINQAYEMDKFVGELISALRKVNEPIVLVMYGDHLPAFDITDDELSAGNTYTTEYVVWNNIGLEKVDEDVEAFQLTSHVMDMLGISGGAISKYHSTLRHSENYDEYLEGLRVLEYDILYGDKEVYGGSLPYSQTNLQMGHKNISIKNVSNADNHFIVVGENFTKFSYVMVNGEYVDTIYSSDEALLVDGITLKEGDSVAVVQKGKDGIKLSSTSLFIFQ